LWVPFDPGIVARKFEKPRQISGLAVNLIYGAEEAFQINPVNHFGFTINAHFSFQSQLIISLL